MMSKGRSKTKMKYIKQGIKRNKKIMTKKREGERTARGSVRG